MSSAHLTKVADSPPALQLGYNLLTIVIGMLVLGLGLAYAIDAFSRGAAPPLAQEPMLTRTMGNKTLNIPASWFRHAEQKVEGFSTQIDLSLHLPIGKGGAPARIEVSLVPQSRARPSATLLDGVYLHQFLNDQLSGPPGLIGKPLKDQDGFANETVWYDPLSATPFAAKCMTPVNPAEPERCLRTVVLIKGMAAIYSFDADVLANWRDFDVQIKPSLQKIGLF